MPNFSNTISIQKTTNILRAFMIFNSFNFLCGRNFIEIFRSLSFSKCVRLKQNWLRSKNAHSYMGIVILCPVSLKNYPSRQTAINNDVIKKCLLIFNCDNTDAVFLRKHKALITIIILFESFTKPDAIKPERKNFKFFKILNTSSSPDSYLDVQIRGVNIKILLQPKRIYSSKFFVNKNGWNNFSNQENCFPS